MNLSSKTSPHECAVMGSLFWGKPRGAYIFYHPRYKVGEWRTTKLTCQLSSRDACANAQASASSELRTEQVSLMYYYYVSINSRLFSPPFNDGRWQTYTLDFHNLVKYVSINSRLFKHPVDDGKWQTIGFQNLVKCVNQLQIV